MAELAVRLAEAYRLIAELTAQAGRLSAQVERLSARVEAVERQSRKGLVHVMTAPFVGQPLPEQGRGPVAAGAAGKRRPGKAAR
jgi:predicted lipoprotein